MDDFCIEDVGNAMIPGGPRVLSDVETAGLWQIFEAIVGTWCPDPGSEGGATRAAKSRSSWLEFVRLRTDSGTAPSYVGEYGNALRVLDALRAAHGKDAIRRLLFPGDAPAESRLGHAKRYVVDEFIPVALVSGGFRHYGGRNYNGYLGGSRFYRAGRICSPAPEAAGTVR